MSVQINGSSASYQSINDYANVLFFSQGVLGVEERQACANAITNCDAYGQAACSAYEEWARQNCPAFCNFCCKNAM